MIASPHAGPLALDAPDLVRQVRRHLDRAGYTEEGVRRALRTDEMGAARSRDNALRQLPLLLHRTRGGDPLTVLLRLFFLDTAVPVDAARRAMAPMALEDWQRLGLIAADGETVRGTVDLFPYENLLVVSDSPWRADPPANHVMGLSESALRLAHITVRRPARRALDLGTGCGFVAFLAAAHSERVVATDCNPRALNLAAFGAQLSGIANVEFRQGDLFEPVRGETFDLVTMNPPFVISPGEGVVWRDSGMRGDHFCRRVLEAVPEYLEEHGWCHLIGNWVQGEVVEDVQLWSFPHCDAWAMRHTTFDPAAYVASWLEGKPDEALEERARRFDAWVAYLEREGVKAIHYGLVTLRKRKDDGHWAACDAAPVPVGPCGEAVVEGFLRRTALRGLSDEALLDVSVRPAPELRWEQQLGPTADGWTGVAANIRLAGGLPFAGALDGSMAALMQLCRGERRLRDLLTELVRMQGWDGERARPAFVQVARGLIEQGFLVFAR
jgi:hypothetical protein